MMQQVTHRWANRITRRFAAACLAGVVVIGSGVVSPARAQLSLGPDTTPTKSLADEFALLSRLALQSDTTVADHQWTRARILLDAALALEPDDASLWRDRAELAREMSDRPAMINALREYCGRAPEDTAAQYQWITARAANAQTLDQRQALIRRLLSAPGAAELDATVRSRLASYLASAAMEQGDGDAVRAHLKQALKLDPINPVAAEMMYDLASRRPTPPAVQGQVLVRLLRAKPAAPEVRVLIGRWLAGQQALSHAADQFQAGATLSRQPVSQGHARDWVAALVASGEPQEALELISQWETELNAAAERARAQAAAEADQDSDATAGSNDAEQAAADPPRDQLSLEIESVRLLASYALGRDARVESSYARMLPRVMRAQDNPDMARDRAWLSVLANRDLAAARAWLERQELDLTNPQAMADMPTAARIAGWLARREGRPAQAMALLRPHAGQDAFATLGLAEALEQTAGPRDPERLSLLRSLAQSEPLGLAGMVAHAQLRALDTPVEPTQDAAAVVGKLTALPARVATPNLEKFAWLDAEIELDQPRYRLLDPIVASVTLTNRSGIDLPLGGDTARDGAVPALASLLITPKRVGQTIGNLPPMIIDLRRRLVLADRQQITVPVRLDRSELGALIGNNPTESITFSSLLVYAPRWVPNQPTAHGPLGETASTAVRQSWGLPATVQNVDRWIDDLAGPDPVSRIAALARLCPIATRLTETEANREQANQIAAAINEAYPGFDTVTQAWTVRFIPADDTSRAMFEPTLTLAARASARSTRLAHLAIHAKGPQSPVITAGLRSDDDTLRAFAAAQQKALIAEQQAQKAREQANAQNQ